MAGSQVYFFGSHWHAAPHVQLSPHAHPARRAVATLWHPHVQVAPTHDAQTQTLGFFDM